MNDLQGCEVTFYFFLFPSLSPPLRQTPRHLSSYWSSAAKTLGCAKEEGKGGRAPHGRGRREERQPTWKKPGGMGPPGIPSFGGMFPSTGLGAAAALCGEQNQDRHVGFELEFRRSVKAFQPPLFAHLPLSTRCFASVPQSRRSPYYNQGFLL